MENTEALREKGESCKGAAKRMPDRLLQRFEDLKRRRQEICKRSTEKRVKKLQENILRKVESEFTKEEDLDLLREHDVVLPGTSMGKQNDESGGKRSVKLKQNESCSKTLSSSEPTDVQENSSDWKDVQRYLGCNDHLKGIDKGKYTAKTKLHIDIENAVAKGEFDKAEQLSDDLATREFGTKIAQAFDAKKYMQEKEKEEEILKARKKKKLHWGFEHKQRWETKSNM